METPSIEDIGAAEEALQRLINERRALEQGVKLLSSFRQAKAELQKLLTDIENKKAELQLEHEKHNAEKQLLMNDIDAFKESIAEEKRKLRSDTDKLKASYAAQEKELNDALEDLKVKRINKENELADVTAAYNTKIAEMVSKLEALKAEHAALIKVIDDVAKAVHTVTDTVTEGTDNAPQQT